MRKETYESKLESLMQSAQFLNKEAITDEVILKTEKELNKKLLARNKKEKTSDQLYSKLRYTRLRHPYDQYYHFRTARMRTLTKRL